MVPMTPAARNGSPYAAPVPPLLLDLGNTVVDRASAFRRWAERFLAEHRPDLERGVEWLVLAGRNGYEPRGALASRVRDAFDRVVHVLDAA
jgi:hypothetical protein